MDFAPHTPVVQLTRENLHFLAEYEYMVGPKADRTCALLLCEAETNNFYMLDHSCPPRRLEGSYKGPDHKGFLLNAEVVSSAGLVLVYDVCCVGAPIEIPIQDKKSLAEPCERTRLSWWAYGVESLQERRDLLAFLVSSISVPGLALKPIACAGKAELMWENWRCLPYKTDGLIFTPCSYTVSLPVIKWKPVEELTLDLALSGVIESKSSDCGFVAHLHQPSHPLRLGSNVWWEPRGNTHNETITDMVASQHYPFNFSERNGKVSLELKKRAAELQNFGETNDLLQTHDEDIQQIEHERHQEAYQWYEDHTLCNATECPCGETLCDQKHESCIAYTGVLLGLASRPFPVDNASPSLTQQLRGCGF